jgi:hypothetical protein
MIKFYDGDKLTDDFFVKLYKKYPKDAKIVSWYFLNSNFPIIEDMLNKNKRVLSKPFKFEAWYFLLNRKNKKTGHCMLCSKQSSKMRYKDVFVCNDCLSEYVFEKHINIFHNPFKRFYLVYLKHFLSNVKTEEIENEIL